MTEEPAPEVGDIDQLEEGIDERPLLVPVDVVVAKRRRDFWKTGKFPIFFVIALVTFIVFLVAGFLISYYSGNSNPGPAPPPKLGDWFLQITDVHLDSKYKAGSDPALYCRAGIGKAGKYGDYKCDTANAMLMSALAAMQHITTDKNVDFVVWSGDSAPHHAGDWTETEVLDSMKVIADAITLSFPTLTTRILPTIGNHDIHPLNHLETTPNNPYYTKVIEGPWKSFDFDDNMKKEFKLGGRYSTLARPQLRVVSLNSMLWYRYNTALNMTALEDDPIGQFVWLSSVLLSAKANNEKVLLLTHIAPGMGRQYDDSNSTRELFDIYNNKLLDILTPYYQDGTIIISVFGHLHSDEIRLLPGGGVGLVAPAIDTERDANNPTVRAVQIDSITHAPLVLEQWWTNMTHANIENKVVWQMLYSTKEDPYNMLDLSRTQWKKFYDSCVIDDGCFDSVFARQLQAAYPFVCGEMCKKRIRCAFMHPRYQDFDTCSH